MTDAIAAPIIRLEDVRRQYGKAAPRAIDGVSLAVNEGDFLVITGPSGSGKSSLLNIIGLLDRPDGGDYLVRGRSISRLTGSATNRLRSQLFGFVFQASHALPTRTIAKNVELPLTVAGDSVADRASRVRRALAQAGIVGRAGRPASTVSGGELQRMAIARALVRRPEILLLDEPTGNLDSVNTRRIIDLLHTLNRSGVTIVAVTHDDKLAAAAGRRIVLVDGRVEEEVGERREWMNAPAGEGDASSADDLSGLVVRKRGASVVSRVLDTISDAWHGLVARPFRTLLLIAVVAFGAGGIVAAQGVSESAAAQINATLADAALDEVTAVPTGSGEGAARFPEDALQRALSLDGVVQAGIALIPGQADISVSRLADGAVNSSGTIGVRGVNAAYLRALGVPEREASFEILDTSAGRFGAFVGQDAARRLGIPGAHEGVNVWINGTPFSVLGVLPSPPRDPRLSDTVVLAAAAMSDRLGLDMEASESLFIVTEPGMSFAVGEALPSAIDPAHPERTRVQAAADLRTLRAGVDSQLGALITMMAGVLLLLAVMATAAVMVNAVLARRFEIGLRRAIGASRGSVARLFILEGIILGAAAGLVGVSIGMGAVLAVCQWQGWSPVLSPESAGLSLLVGVVVGTISTLIPAIQASRVQPALALRS